MKNLAHVPQNEMARIIKLAELDVDYSVKAENLHSLGILAATVAGTEVSLINLIDLYTQWTIANYGLEIDQMARKDSVCQYTLMEKEDLEIKDMSIDQRFKNNFYVSGEVNLRYYFGVPLKTCEGYPIGALCVLDKTTQELTQEKKQFLKLIAAQVISQLTKAKAPPSCTIFGVKNNPR